MIFCRIEAIVKPYFHPDVMVREFFNCRCFYIGIFFLKQVAFFSKTKA